MGLEQFMKALTMVPQIVESIKKMSEEDKKVFVERLGLQDEDKEAAEMIITGFQEGKTMDPEQQRAAHKLLEKALEMNQLDLSSLFNLKGN